LEQLDRGPHITGRPYSADEARALKEKGIRSFVIDRGDDLRLARPERHLVPGPAQHARHCRAEGPATDYSDAPHGIIL
jgi:hypothetical protein